MFPSLVRLSALVWSFQFVSLVSVDALSPPQRPQEPSAGVQRSTGGKHCLWRVTDAKAPIYLLGSIHSMRKKDYPLPPVVEQAIQESQEFYFEIDPRGDAELGKKLGAAAVLAKRRRDQTKDRSESLELPGADFDREKLFLGRPPRLGNRLVCFGLSGLRAHEQRLRT